MTFKFRQMVAVGLSAAIVACSPAQDDPNTDETVLSGPVAATVQPGTVQVSGDGVSVSGPLGTYLAFNSQREPVEQELAKALGEPQARDSNDECGAGPMEFTTFTGGLTLNFQNGNLVGWFIQKGDGAVDITTAEGIGLGSAMTAVEAVYSVEMMEDSTLGSEFFTDEQIGGFLGKSDGNRVIESLYAGTNCFFR